MKAPRRKLTIAATLAGLAIAPAARAAATAWNGTWTLDASRKEPDGAADAYRFTVSPGGDLVWEIPSLGEVVRGRLDGRMMAIRRSKPTPGLTLAVVEEGPLVWRYSVAKNGKPQGEGRMELAKDGRSWTDVPLDHGKPVQSLLMVYKKE